MIRQRSKYNSSKLAKKKRRILIFRLILYPIFFITLIIGLSFFSHSDFLTIKQVKVVGAKNIEQKNIKDIVENEIEKPFLKIFSRENFILYPKSRIKALLYDEFKRIAKLDVDLKGFKILEIEVSERAPKAIWCENEAEVLDEEISEPKENDSYKIITQESCFFVDKFGYIFDSSPIFSGDSFLRYEGKLIAKEPIGSYFFLERNALKLEKFLSLLGQLDTKPVRVIKNSSDEVIVVLENGTELILSFDSDMEEIFQNLATLVSEPTLRMKSSSLFSNFQYIDLRFGNKLLYKLKTEVSEQTTEQEEE